MSREALELAVGFARMENELCSTRAENAQLRRAIEDKDAVIQAAWNKWGDDNRIENLELFGSQSEHAALHRISGEAAWEKWGDDES